ncbi:hypothetical protein HKD37_05G012188 [Glycine soja]
MEGAIFLCWSWLKNLEKGFDIPFHHWFSNIRDGFCNQGGISIWTLGSFELRILSDIGSPNS